MMAAFLGVMATEAASAAPVSDVVCQGDGARFALLIGNQDYRGQMQALSNPRRDVERFASVLCKFGFTVLRATDLDIDTFDRSIDTFVNASKDAKTKLVYYSGHGFAIGRRNWLVPVDAALTCEDIAGESDASTRLSRRLVDLDAHVFARLQGGDQIIILDACRTDPVRGCRGNLNLTLVKGVERITQGQNARMIVYATQDGQVALDSVQGSETSPLMTVMAERLPADPQRDWVSAMVDVSREVFRLTQSRQLPNLDVSLGPQGCLAGYECGSTVSVPATPVAPPPATVPPAPPPVNAARPDAEAEYRRAADLNTLDGWRSLLKLFPDHPRKEAILIAIRRLQEARIEEARLEDARQREEALWRDAEAKTGRAAIDTIDLLLTTFPSGVYAERARQRRVELLASLIKPPSLAEPAQPPVAQTAPEPTPTYCVTGLSAQAPYNFLVLRPRPSLQSGWDPNIKLYNGSNVTVLETDGDFYRIRIATGEVGWASRSYIVPCGTVPDPPAVTRAPDVSRDCTVAGLSAVGPDNWLALRSAPSRTAPFPSSIKMFNGTPLRVLGRTGEWYRVQLRSGTVGWVNTSYVRCP